MLTVMPVAGKKGHMARACQSKPREQNFQKPNQQSTHNVTESQPSGIEEEQKPDNCYTLFSVAGETKLIVVIASVQQPAHSHGGRHRTQVTFEQKFNNIVLNPTDMSLCSYAGEPRTVLGTTDVNVEYNS